MLRVVSITFMLKRENKNPADCPARSDSSPLGGPQTKPGLI